MTLEELIISLEMLRKEHPELSGQPVVVQDHNDVRFHFQVLRYGAAYTALKVKTP